MVVGKYNARSAVFQCEAQYLFDIDGCKIIAPFTNQLFGNESASTPKVQHPEFFVRQIPIDMLQVVVNPLATIEHGALFGFLLFAASAEFERGYNTDCLGLADTRVAA